jgi:hypothetical protein
MGFYKGDAVAEYFLISIGVGLLSLTVLFVEFVFGVDTLNIRISCIFKEIRGDSSLLCECMDNIWARILAFVLILFAWVFYIWLFRRYHKVL